MSLVLSHPQALTATPLSPHTKVRLEYCCVVYRIYHHLLNTSLQHSSIEIKVPTVDGFYISQMNLIVSHDLPSDVLLGSDWILLYKPVFIDSHPFILNPAPETAQELPHPHSWQPINGLFLCFHVAPLP